MAARREPRVTRADVARLADVSVATVSYVLNNVKNQTISETTRRAVTRAAERLGYRPNLAARNLAVGVSGVVLYVIPRSAPGQLALAVGSQLTTALARRGIVLTLQFETDDAAGMADTIANLHPIAVTSVLPLNPAAAAVVAEAGIPAMHTGSTGVPELGALYLAAGDAQVAHLAARGHQRLGFAFSDDPALRSLGERRLTAVRAACAGRDLPEPVAESLATDGGNAADVVTGWLDRGVTAVCGYDDPTALIVLHGLRQLGLRCPDDLAVIGIDAGPLGFVSNPPLTTIGFDAPALVELAVAGLLAALGYPAGETPATTPIIQLIERNST